MAGGGAATTIKYNTEDKPQEIDFTVVISYRRFWILAIHLFPEFSSQHYSRCVGCTARVVSCAGRRARGWGGRDGPLEKGGERGVRGLGAADARPRGLGNGGYDAGAAAQEKSRGGPWDVRCAGTMAGTDERRAGKADVCRAEGASIRRHERDRAAAESGGLGWGGTIGRVGGGDLVADGRRVGKANVCRAEGALIRRHGRDRAAAESGGLGWGGTNGRVGGGSLVAGKSNADIRKPGRSHIGGRVEEIGFEEGNSNDAIRAPGRVYRWLSQERRIADAMGFAAVWGGGAWWCAPETGDWNRYPLTSDGFSADGMWWAAAVVNLVASECEPPRKRSEMCSVEPFRTPQSARVRSSLSCLPPKRMRNDSGERASAAAIRGRTLASVSERHTSSASVAPSGDLKKTWQVRRVVRLYGPVVGEGAGTDVLLGGSAAGTGGCGGDREPTAAERANRSKRPNTARNSGGAGNREARIPCWAQSSCNS